MIISDNFRQEQINRFNLRWEIKQKNSEEQLLVHFWDDICDIWYMFLWLQKNNSFLEQYAKLSGGTFVALLEPPFFGCTYPSFLCLNWETRMYVRMDPNDSECGVFLQIKSCTNYWSHTDQGFFRVYLNDYGVNLYKDRNKWRPLFFP